MNSDQGSVDYLTNNNLLKSPSRSTLDIKDTLNLVLQERCIDLNTSTALNVLDGTCSLREILFSCPESRHAMVSDVDQQLILKVFFREPVSVKYITIRANMKPENTDTSPPKTVKLYSNRTDFDFSESDMVDPDQVVELKDHESVEKIKLKGTKFTHVNCLQIFVVDNTEDTEQTFINELVIWGNIHPNYKSDY